MDEEDRLFNFLAGLQGWAQAELRRKGVKDIPSAIAAAKALVDYRGDTLGGSYQGRARRKSASPPKNRGGRKKEDTGKAAARPRSKQRSFGGCFICEGLHMVRDYPKRTMMNAINTQEDKESKTSGDELARLNPLQCIHAIVTEDQDLMHVKVRVNGHDLRAVVDTGATHNFMRQGVACKLGLGELTNPCQVKLADSKVVESCGQTMATLGVGAWTERCSMTVVPIDDFDFVLGIEFFRNAKVVIVPYLHGMMIGDEQSPCFVPAIKGDRCH